MTWKCEDCELPCFVESDLAIPKYCPIAGGITTFKPIDIEAQSIDHPDYYGGKDNPYETVKVWFANGWGVEACLANAYKYMTRQGKKDGEPAVKDLKKARNYLDMLISYLEEEE